MNAITNIVVFGATSAICHSILKLFTAQKCRLILYGRDPEKLDIIASDLESRGAEIAATGNPDFSSPTEIDESFGNAVDLIGTIDLVLVAHGNLPDQEAVETSIASATECIASNYTSYVYICLAAASMLERQDHGSLAAITSVAGDRGRKSNYIYGSAKGGISILLQGLQGRLASKNITVTDIKPGMIDTPMTAEFKKGAIWSRPDEIAPHIVRGIRNGKRVIYAPAYWRYIMLIIKLMPAALLHRLSL